MKFYSASLFSLSVVYSAVHACQREHLLERDFSYHSLEHALAKRQESNVPFPPVLNPEETILVNRFDNNTLDQWTYYYTHGLHLAGTNQSMAQWTADRWGENGFTSGLAEYYTLLNYPQYQSLSITFPNGATTEVELQEDVLEADSTTSYPNRVPTFHGYSFSGNATAEFVYVGRGQQVDFARLIALGVPLEGKIALARYGGPFRGLKVKNAQQHGMIGAVIYTDLGDDGNNTVLNGVAAYPDGPARNPSQVQRGSVQFLSIYPGDPTTPGYPSKRDSPRADTKSVLPSIPSLPLSWRSAQALLEALDGQGPSGTEVNRTNWIGAANTTYGAGPSAGTTLSITNNMRSEITWIWDAIGYINGTDYPDEVVIIGNHRDAWIIGGAADPNSGTAVIVELSRAFNALLATGWKPKRTILLGSWDAEEYGLVGSTEWVEEHLPWLTTVGVTYLNLDIATSGPNPDLSCTPDLHDIALETMKKVIYPFRGMNDLTLYDVWYSVSDGEIGVLGSGSDYTSFLHAAGISALDTGAGGGPSDPIYPYHSNYDSYNWMTQFGDPNYVTHIAMGQFVALMVYQFASRDILPLNPRTYVTEMQSYYEALQDTYSSNADPSNETQMVDLQPIQDAITSFSNDADTLFTFLNTNPTDANVISVVNSKLRDFQRGFISQGGLPGREFYKHVVFAPGLDTGYAPVTFPGVTEALTAGDFDVAREWVGKTSRGILRAGEILRTGA